jgi:hypothetical protein
MTQEIEMENKMKNMISVFVLINLFSTGAFATEIDCDLNHKDLQRVVIKTGYPGSVTLQFHNGDFENLKPVKGVGGEFGEIVFPDKIQEEAAFRKLNFVLVKSSRLGEVKMAYICNAYTRSCDTRGSGFALEASAAFRIQGELIQLNGKLNPLCRRTVL